MMANDKLIQLFKFVQDLYKLRQEIVIDVRKQQWHRFIDDILKDFPTINFNYLDQNDEEEIEDVILEVRKPEFEDCPQPPASLDGWLEEGWKDYRRQAVVKEKQIINGRTVEFGQNETRAADFRNWIAEREEWASRQREISTTRAFFQELYDKYISLNRDSETIELMVGQGIIECLDNNGEQVYHPILLKRLEMRFDARQNIIYIVDTDVKPELYTLLFQRIDFVNHGVLKKLLKELNDNCYHPLNRDVTVDYLKSLIHRLDSKSRYVSAHEDRAHDERILLRNRPVFFIRKRNSGVISAIDAIIEELTSNQEIDTPLLNLVGEKKQPQQDAEDDFHSFAALSGEDKDILLSKEANKEQLEIAKRIEQYNAVLVQGPPGTGKTHTIANLIGHFLAQGKNILITSHTRKALSVVKDKVAEPIQHLCVSALTDNNQDMMRSIDGISDYISRHTAAQLAEKTEKLEAERNRILTELEKAREKLYTLIHKEYRSIVIDGKDFAPIDAARFVSENQNELGWIPGKVQLYQPLPVSEGDIELLYQTNALFSKADEQELFCQLPNPRDLLSPEKFKELVREREALKAEIEAMQEKLAQNYVVEIDEAGRVYLDGTLLCQEADEEELVSLSKIGRSSADAEPEWCLAAILDGKRGGGFREVWEKLIQQIEATNQLAESFYSQSFGKEVAIDKQIMGPELLATLEKMRYHLSQGRKFSGFTLFLKKSWKATLESVKINNECIKSADDCELVIRQITLNNKRKELETFWRELITKRGGPDFSTFGDLPEQLCRQRIPRIKEYLNWYASFYRQILEKMKRAGLPPAAFIKQSEFSNPYEEVSYLQKIVYEIVPLCARLVLASAYDMKRLEAELADNQNRLICGKAKDSFLCQNLFYALNSYDVAAYENHFNVLAEYYAKYHYFQERARILKALEPVAPDWCSHVKNRIGIHGESTPPPKVRQAWLWKQLAGILDDLLTDSLESLQREVLDLSRNLRKLTTELIEAKAWYHLAKRIENDVEKKQALQGWKLTVKKMGKTGTGKNVPRLRKEAQKLIAKCQSAVPAWIMPINKALESLDPKHNKFDVVIIDEASQSDVSALAIMYLANRIIIVGDDEQVSPMGIGVETDKIESLKDTHIKGIIPNYHLYDLRTSLYDLAKTTFPVIMLREHFRCVPEIIQYSNKLSYDWKIKPLRDNSTSKLKPATIAYRVAGKRDEKRKINLVEAQNIAALLIACSQLPEYEKATFGVISLLGEEQAFLIDELLRKHMTPLEYEKRKILCGNAAHFQGDERDVIFLSLVDSTSAEGGVLKRTGEGVESSTKKRYNVAVSRARDQLWVVHSMDLNYLQPGDMRRDLIEYAQDPYNVLNKIEELQSRGESPFEQAVIRDLVSRGYHVIPQYQVGAYRIDLVVVSGQNKIAIECDGDQYHSGEEKVREDMERQIILERLGWRFIRIRGSEYYRDPQAVMKRVISRLEEYEIFPEAQEHQPGTMQDDFLLDKVQRKASEILAEWTAAGEIPIFLSRVS